MSDDTRPTRLVECPDCGRRVSPSAAACPQCGRPIVQQAQRGEGIFLRTLNCGCLALFAAIALVVLVFILLVNRSLLAR